MAIVMAAIASWGRKSEQLLFTCLDTCLGLLGPVGFQVLPVHFAFQTHSFGINRCLYEKIARYGADIKNVKRYFEGADPYTEKLLRDLAMLRKEAITIPYDENIEIQNRISQLDIAIMKECDRRFS